MCTFALFHWSTHVLEQTAQNQLIYDVTVLAGHSDVVSFLLHNFRVLRIDHVNKLGFTALMKAAIQGRTKCAKLILFAGILAFLFVAVNKNIHMKNIRFTELMKITCIFEILLHNNRNNFAHKCYIQAFWR